MKKYFVRGIIFASICLFYSTHSLSLVRERNRSFVINNFIAAKFLGSMLIQEWISPIYRFFYSEKTQNQANNGYFQANLPCDREHIEMFVDLPIGRYVIKRMVKNCPIARKQIIPHIIDNIKFAGSQDGRLFITEIIEKYPDAREQIIQYIVSDFNRLIESWDGINLIEKIIIIYPDVRQQIISYIVNDFNRLIELQDGRLLIENIIKRYPDARQQVISYMVNNFDRLIESFYGIYSIREIIEKYPDAREQIIPCIISNIERLAESSEGKYLTEKIIIEKYPDAREQIILSIVNSFERLIESLEGRSLIKVIIEKNPDAREQIISYIVNNFDRLIESNGGRLLVKVIIEKYPDVREQIAPCIINNFDRLIELDGGRLLVKVIIEKYPDVREQITPCIIKNVARLIESDGGRLLVKVIIEKYPDVREQIAPCIIKNVARLIESCSGTFLIKVIIEKDPSARQYIKENYKKKKITKLPLLLFSYFCEKFPQDKCLRDRLKEESHEYGIEGIIKRILYLKSCPTGKNDRLESSLSTVKHIERYRNEIITELIEEHAFSSNFSSMLDRAFKKEVELEKSGYVAFKHGQEWGHGLPEKWFTTLWAITKEKQVTGFIFLHVKPLIKDNNLAGETEMRERLLRNEMGSYNDWQHLLFMNYALFGNTDNLWSSSVGYAVKNHNEGKINISLKNVFNYLGHEDIYKKYEKQLQELEQEYQGLSKYGSMVVIGVPEDKLSDSVYLTTSRGQKKKIHIEGIGETDDIKTIITTLRHAPEKIKDSDRMEFVLTMTQDKHGGLNPESGIKVHMFDAVDPEKLAVFRKKESLLLEQIKQEIRQEKSKESAATANQFIRSAL